MKKLILISTAILAIFAFACTGIPTPVSGTVSGVDAVTYGFPADFPVLQDTGGPGSGSELKGFGGVLSTNQAGNRALVTKVPVIFIHGNGGTAIHTQWGGASIRSFLKAAGYSDAEIWACSYLGANNTSADLNDPHKNNINDVRLFIDTVMTYLGVDRVVLIGHSLGVGMIRSYMLGLTNTGSFDQTKTRFTKIAALIGVAGANYGLGTYSVSEFKSGSTFEMNSHKVPGTSVTDDTPYGTATVSQMNGVNPSLPLSRSYNGSSSFKAASSLDGQSSNRIFYTGITATGDYVDGQLANTGYFQGADYNHAYSVGTSLAGHEAVIKSQAVFDGSILPTLNLANALYGPSPKPIVTINPNGGNFSTSSLSVTITATNNPTSIQYSTDGTNYSAYTNAITITATTTIYAKATNTAGTSAVVSATFTKVAPQPPVTTITPDSQTFRNSINVSISATDNAAIQYQINSGSWTNYTGTLAITATSTVSAKSTNENGTSATVTKTYTLDTSPEYETAYGTATDHYLAGRAVIGSAAPNGYTYLGTKYGYSTNFPMYKVSGSSTWTDIQPGGTTPPVEVPVTAISPSSQTFTTSVSVTISATNSGTIEYQINGGSWTAYSGALTITATSTVSARATNSAGTSATVTNTYTKQTAPAYETATGTATQHYVAGRAIGTYPATNQAPNGYLYLGTKYGYSTSFPMYKVSGSTTWTDIQPQ